MRCVTIKKRSASCAGIQTQTLGSWKCYHCYLARRSHFAQSINLLFPKLNLLQPRTHLEKVFRVNFSERFIPSFQFEPEWKEVFRFFVDILSKQLTRNILLRLRKFITPSLVRSYNGAREGILNPKVARNVEKERALHDASDEQGFGSKKAA